MNKYLMAGFVFFTASSVAYADGSLTLLCTFPAIRMPGASADGGIHDPEVVPEWIKTFHVKDSKGHLVIDPDQQTHWTVTEDEYIDIDGNKVYIDRRSLMARLETSDGNARFTAAPCQLLAQEPKI